MVTILHMIDTSGPGGAETVFMNLVEGFNHGGFRSVALVTKGAWVKESLTACGVKSYSCDSNGSWNTRYLREIMRVVRRERVDLIQAHLAGPSVYGSLAGVLTRTPTVSVFHGLVDLEMNDPLDWVKVAVISRCSDRIVTVSNSLRDNLQNRTSLNAGKMEVIHNGVDLVRFVGLERNLVRRELGLGPETFVVCSLGNIRSSKGYEYLIAAAAIVVGERPHIHFVIAGHGKGELFAGLHDQRRQQKVEANVHFLGFRDDALDVLSSSDLFLLPSTSEGFSISTIEAMACGLPVVVTRSGGPEEIVVDNVNGVFVPPASSGGIARKILELEGSATTRQALGSSASAAVAEKFSLAAMLHSYRRLYQDVLSPPKSLDT